MAQFEGLLKSSLDRTTESVSQAQRDLNRLMDEINATIRKEGGDLAELKLDEEWDLPSGTVLDLTVQDKIGRDVKRTIDYLQISPNGYPIRVGAIDYPDNPALPVRFTPDKDFEIHDSGELEAYFAKLLADENSPLVSFLAFMSRQQRSA